MFAKLLEIEMKMSLKQIMDNIWSVTHAKLYNKKTGEIFLLKSEIARKTQNMLNKLFKILSH